MKTDKDRRPTKGVIRSTSVEQDKNTKTRPRQKLLTTFTASHVTSCPPLMHYPVYTAPKRSNQPFVLRLVV